MSRLFTDHDLRTWEAYASGGRRGFPGASRIVFHCLSDADARARFVTLDDEADDAAATVRALPDARLLELFAGSRELE
ncbi:MAG TPA: hypothetical protein VFI96_04475 [Longimicrobiaceae bacterium]|nr:hypothetical protein [Longimicrobiaceae bacterium]